MKIALKVFLLGFFFAPLGDMVHVATHTTWYPSGYAYYFMGIPWWVFPFFGVSGLIVGFSGDFFDQKILKTKVIRPGEQDAKKAIIGIFSFLVAYLLSGVLKGHPIWFIHLVLGGVTFLYWFYLERTWQGILVSLGPAIGGTLVEIMLVKNGVFKYLPPDTHLFGVASWLPWAYMILGLSLGNLIRFLKRMDKIRR
ncbi:MAG: hypothetical protein DRQ88_07500 [Epsilonproteobacteria bacterium]|nr:MAG: hypothetical protein DRQ89_12375 [Campylobacterota bacterium]RLA66169.1 MAG: hypothetical protein DRQ88_07500 [Campylobacterota bacterium]